MKRSDSTWFVLFTLMWKNQICHFCLQSERSHPHTTRLSKSSGCSTAHITLLSIYWYHEVAVVCTLHKWSASRGFTRRNPWQVCLVSKLRHSQQNTHEKWYGKRHEATWEFFSSKMDVCKKLAIQVVCALICRPSATPANLSRSLVSKCIANFNRILRKPNERLFPLRDY